MDHPYGKQYGQEGNPRAYMTMRDYRNLPYQWGNQQPVGRNPNPPRSMREYRDQWMSAPVYHVPSTETSKAWDEPRPREEEGLRYPSNQGETIHTISEKTLMREKLTILTRRLDEMEMKNQHNIHSVNEFSASQPSFYNHQSHGHYGENCQENVQILNQGRPPMSVLFGNSYIQNWKNHSNLPGNPKLPPTDQQQFAPTSQQQQPPPLHPLVEQAILALTRKVNNYVEENKKARARSIVTVEYNLNKKIDGLKDDFEHKRDNLQDSIGDLIEHQQPPPVSLVEQAILNLSKQVDNFIENNRVVNVQTVREIETVKSSLNKRTDGLQSEIDQKLDIQQESILKLVPQFVHQEEKNLEEESQEDESLTETVLVEQAQLQPQEELEVKSVKAPEDLQDASVTFWPWKQEEQITALISEEGSGKEIVEDPQQHVLQPIPTNPTANAQATKNPLPPALSTDQVYILPTSQSQHKTPADPKAKSNLLHVVQNFKELVASVHALATTSKTMATAYIA